MIPARRHLVQNGKVLLDLSVLGMAFYLAILIRFEGVVPSHLVEWLPLTLPLVVLVQVACLASFGTRRSSWRYVSLSDAQRFFAALGLAGVVVPTLRWTAGPFLDRLSLFRLDAVPLGVILMDVPLSFLAILGLRVGGRLWGEYSRRTRARTVEATTVPTLLIGAGSAGALVAREIAARPELGIRPLGFLDDDPNLQGLVINGFPVLGTTVQFAVLAERHGIRQALITIANPPHKVIHRMVDQCRQAAASRSRSSRPYMKS